MSIDLVKAMPKLRPEIREKVLAVIALFNHTHLYFNPPWFPIGSAGKKLLDYVPDDVKRSVLEEFKGKYGSTTPLKEVLDSKNLFGLDLFVLMLDIEDELGLGYKFPTEFWKDRRLLSDEARESLKLGDILKYLNDKLPIDYKAQ